MTIKKIEQKINQQLQAEHLGFLSAKVHIGFITDDVDEIVFATKDCEVFAIFYIDYSKELGYAIDKREAINSDSPIAKSKLLQQLLITLIEETLDETL